MAQICTFVVWEHGAEKHKNSLNHIKSIHLNIQFTIEVETESKIAFFGVLLLWKRQWLGHTVYKKPTHTDRYLHNNSNNHPRQKQRIKKKLAGISEKNM